VAWTYDNTYRLTNETVSYDPANKNDDVGRLGTVVDNRLTGSNTTTYSYDPASNLATAVYPNQSPSQPITFTYDTLDRLTALSLPVSSYTYQLSTVGNRTSVTEGTGRTLNWTYDNIYRLTNETIGNDPANKNGSVGYGLDPVGNRQSETSTLSGLDPGSFTYNVDDELTTNSYDNNGNTTQSGANSFIYDSENELKTMNGGAVSILYDGDGNRVANLVSI
jgi:YD repeat-containing protein